MLRIRRSHNCLIFDMGIPIPGKDGLYIETRPSRYLMYRKTSNISRTSVSNIIVDHSDVVGASPVSPAPTTSSFSTEHLDSINCTKTTVR